MRKAGICTNSGVISWTFIKQETQKVGRSSHLSFALEQTQPYKARVLQLSQTHLYLTTILVTLLTQIHALFTQATSSTPLFCHDRSFAYSWQLRFFDDAYERQSSYAGRTDLNAGIRQLSEGWHDPGTGTYPYDYQHESARFGDQARREVRWLRNQVQGQSRH